MKHFYFAFRISFLVLSLTGLFPQLALLVLPYLTNILMLEHLSNGSLDLFFFYITPIVISSHFMVLNTKSKADNSPLNYRHRSLPYLSTDLQVHLHKFLLSISMVVSNTYLNLNVSNKNSLLLLKCSLLSVFLISINENWYFQFAQTKIFEITLRFLLFLTIHIQYKQFFLTLSLEPLNCFSRCHSCPLQSILNIAQ